MNDVCRLFDFLAALFVLLTGCLSGYAISYWNGYEYRGPTHDTVDERSSSGKFFNDVKVLCLVMTFSVNHKWKALPVVETWGNLCNRILFVSNATDDELPTLIVDLHESRDDLWLKTRKAFEWIYQNTLDDYDWFLKADDDTYFHMDNLRGFLKNYSPEQPFSIGHLFKVSGMHDTYHSGGAGYILSREALRKLGGKGFTRDANCVQKNEHEDLFMGRCLKSLGIDLIDGADKNGAYRFHPIAIWDLLTNNAPKWLADKSTTHLKYICHSISKGTDLLTWSLTKNKVEIGGISLLFVIFHLNALCKWRRSIYGRIRITSSEAVWNGSAVIMTKQDEDHAVSRSATS